MLHNLFQRHTIDPERFEALLPGTRIFLMASESVQHELDADARHQAERRYQG